MKAPLSLVVALACFLAFKVNGLVSDDPVLPVTLNIPVWIAGIPDVSPGVLSSSLQNILPRYFPATEGGKPVHDVQLSLNYEVRRTPEHFLQRYEAFILEHASTEEGIHIVFVDEVANFVRGEMEDDPNFTFSFPTYDIFTLPVVVLDSKSAAKHKIVSNGEELDQCTMSVLSSVAFIDLSAVTCDITNMIPNNAKQIRWATPAVSAPFPFTFPLSKKAKYLGSQQSYSNHLTSRVAGLVTSAIQAMTTSNLKWRPAQATEKIYCPIVLLKNGLGIAGQEQLPNIPALESWLQSILLPNQEVVLITTVHYIDEHPQLSVAVASSHMTYAATVAGTPTIPTHIEKIPYIDSNLLFHELTSVGDRLCDLLLHQTGHGEALRNLMQEEEVKDSIGPKIKAGRSDLTAKEKNWRSAAVVPVFVIGDVHIHHERQLNLDTADDVSKNGDHFPSAIVDIPVQPLFNKDSTIAVDSDSSSVLVLHSTHPKVSTFSPHTKSWKEIGLSDLDSLIAEGLTRALTGFNAPHAQLEKVDVVDLTFTHGTHPFGPFGQLPYEPSKYHSIFSTSIQRGTLIARAHRVMQRAISISHRAAALDSEISDGFRYLHSLHGSSRQAGKSFASVNSRAQTGDFGEGVKLLDTNVDLPAMMMEHLRDITDRSKKLTSDIHFLRDGFRIGKIDQILEVLSNLEEGIDEAELFIEETETVMHLQLNNCHVSFDVDPHLVDQITDRKLSQSAFDRMSMSPHSRRKDQNAFDSGHFSNLYIAAAVIVMVIIGLTIRTVHLKMTKQLRKRL